jgi:hypothetical protein
MLRNQCAVIWKKCSKIVHDFLLEFADLHCLPFTDQPFSSNNQMEFTINSILYVIFILEHPTSDVPNPASLCTNKSMTKQHEFGVTFYSFR